MDCPSKIESLKMKCKEECIFCKYIESCQNIYEEGCCPLEEEE